MDKNKYKLNSSSGFSLVELLVVVGILFILLAFTSVTTSGLYQDVIVDREVILLKNNLEKIRDRAITGKLDSAWSIKFEEDKYTIFKGDNFEGRNLAYDKEFNIPFGMEITTPENPFIFQKISGKPSIAGETTIDIVYQIPYNPQQTKEREIKIETEGLITIVY